MIFIILLTMFSFEAKAKLSLYEYGLAVGGGYISDYPAADQGRIRTVYVPTFRYRGDLFRSDDKGTRAMFFRSSDLDVDLSFGASFPANSKDNSARQGMDDLNWLAELGPRINYTILKQKQHSVELELPIRLVYETDFQFTKEQGHRFVPQIDYKYYFTPKYILNLSFKTVWADEKLNDYFYEVKGSDVTETRGRYNSKGGHLSYDTSAFLLYEGEKLFYLGGFRISNYANSVNNESPLYRVNQDTAVFFAVNYFFYKSKSLEK